MSKRCQDCKMWKAEIPQEHWSICEAETTRRIVNEETGKLEFITKYYGVKTSRYTTECYKFEQKTIRRTWK